MTSSLCLLGDGSKRRRIHLRPKPIKERQRSIAGTSFDSAVFRPLPSAPGNGVSTEIRPRTDEGAKQIPRRQELFWKTFEMEMKNIAPSDGIEIAARKEFGGQRATVRRN
ncbi:hypothetical protein L596_007923 [Steinernema carpocapsae]|uniref:Uncharacterized protein n=1 Tax=Steinernema carpocapsae TaxID=34508 RepID=A0A4U5PBD8_STECR|nr:hypothetical protein L596_007923 [Steinernema carpocapsae]